MDHIGIAVKSLVEAVESFKILLGKEPEGFEEVADQKVRAAIFGMEGTRLEFLEGTAPDSPISRFIEKKGAGIHHVCFKVEDIDAEIERLKAAGFRMIDEQPRTGAEGAKIAFVHPKSTAGILIELNQK